MRKQRGLWLYYTLALLLTWGCWIPTLVIAAQRGITLPVALTWALAIVLQRRYGKETLSGSRP